jgi:AraC family transcriptional regulator of adaptative response / DNA-3-methyladenine glycosylase II
VGYLAMRVLGAPDKFLANDAAVRNGIKALSGVACGAADAGAGVGCEATGVSTD